MERIENDSPRQPVWGTPVMRDQTIVGYAEITENRITAYSPLRCICGARQTPAGDLPCGH